MFAHVTYSAIFVWFLFVSTLKAMPVEASEDRPRILCAASGAAGDPRTRERQYPDAPWCWNIYLQNWAIFGVNVGKYSIHGASEISLDWFHGKKNRNPDV